MPLLADMLDRDLAEMIADLPSVITWMQARTGTTATWSGTISSRVDQRENSIGTMVEDRDIEIVVRAAGIAIAPVPGDKVSVNSLTYRIDSVETAQDGVSYSIQCKREFR